MPENLAIVIGGPTASGKSRLAIDLALTFDGVVVNADASQVYKSIPVISAAPSAEDKQKAPHRLYEYLEDEENGNVVSWLEDAAAEIRKAFSAGRTPVVVGGQRSLSGQPDQRFDADPRSRSRRPRGGAGNCERRGRRRSV